MSPHGNTGLSVLGKHYLSDTGSFDLIVAFWLPLYDKIYVITATVNWLSGSVYDFVLNFSAHILSSVVIASSASILYFILVSYCIE